MSVRDEILKKRQSMTIKQISETAPEETRGMKILRVLRKIKKGANYIGIGGGITPATGSYSSGSSNSAKEFRESHHIHSAPPAPSYSERLQELRNMKSYLETIDGKGDHDCGHEH